MLSVEVRDRLTAAGLTYHAVNVHLTANDGA